MIDLHKEELVSPCGIYCGACSKFKKGVCSGCRETSKAAWCKVRVCAADKGYKTCAECDTYDDVMDCPIFNSFHSRLYSMLFRIDKKACLDRIAEIGLMKYSREMSFKDEPVFKK